METSVKTAEVISPQPSVVPPSPDESADGQAACSPAPEAPAAAHFSGDHLEDMSNKLEDILNTYGSAASLMDKTVVVKPDEDRMEEEPSDDVTIAKEAGNVMQSLNKLSSPDEKLQVLVKKYAELAEARRVDDKRQRALQQKHAVLLRERENLQAENSRSILARSKMETLCRELQRQNKCLKEETLQRCREDEEKRTEISGHFQRTLTDIQAQIEQHSNRNTKLCSENAQLAEKLESLMNQYENREESLEKLNKHRDLQLKLSDTRLEQSQALLAEAEEKHKREKEYLLVQAAEWKLQAQQLKEHGTIMQAQLTLYSQKFDEFQITLAKSNDIYKSFKQEMDKMTGKMKKLEKESNVWKTRFESCNQALAGMIEERAEKDKEFESFVMKIQKLELLCRALQDERKALYDKIKDVRSANTQSGITFKANMGLSEEELSTPVIPSVPVDSAPGSGLLTTVEIQEIEEQDPVLTQGMNRLKEEQARLQEFAASLLSPSSDAEEDKDDESEEEEDDLFAGITKQSRNAQKKTTEESVVPEKKAEAKPDAAPPTAEAAVVAEPASKTEDVEEIHKETAPEHEEQPTASVPVTEPVKEEASLSIESTDSRPEPEEVKQPTPTAPVPEENKQLAPEPLSAPTKVESNPPEEAKPVEEKVQAEVMEIEQPTPAAAAAPVQEEKTQKDPCVEPVQQPAPVQPEEHSASENATATTSHADRANNNNSNPQQPMRKKKKRNNKKV